MSATASATPGFALEGTIGRTTLDLRAYRLTAIQKAAYRSAARFSVELGPVSGETLAVTMHFPDGTSEGAAREATGAFLRDVLDEELRARIGEETAPLRTLILAHAFSRTGLVRRDG